MKRGFMSTIWKQVNNLQNIALKMNQTLKNHTKVAQKSRSCSLFSSIVLVLFIRNSFRVDKQSIKNIIWASWRVCVKIFVRNGQICGYYTTIMHHSTNQSWYTNFWPKSQQMLSIKHCIHQLWPRVTFSYFLDSNYHSREDIFYLTEAIQENSQKELKAIPSSAFDKCFEGWEKRWQKCIALDGAYFEGDNKVSRINK